MWSRQVVHCRFLFVEKNSFRGDLIKYFVVVVAAAIAAVAIACEYGGGGF